MKVALILVFVPLLCLSALSQTPPAEHPGIQLYKQGKYTEAAKILSLAVKDKYFKVNADLWNYLGLAYVGTNDYKKARKALDKAVELQPESSTYHTNLSYVDFLLWRNDEAMNEASKAISLDRKDVSAYQIRGMANVREQKLDKAQEDAEQMMAIDKTDPRGYLLSSQVIMARLERKLVKEKEPSLRDNLDFISDARDVLRRGAESSKDDRIKKILSDELESVEAFYSILSKEPRKPSEPAEAGVTPLRVLAKPRANYTDSARSNNIQGVIRAAVLLGADGRVRYVLLLSRLGYGLDEEVIKAARQIKFEPKTKDGRPVPSVVTFEYSFTIY